MKTRDIPAALRFLQKASKRHCKPERIITDGLRPYPAAARDLGNLERRRTPAGLLSEDIDPHTGELWGNYPQT